MPWRCPACSSTLRHHELEERPQTGERYRCHVCRLTLDFDESLGKLVVPPFELDLPEGPKRSRGKRSQK